jgi:hypothetical protein
MAFANICSVSAVLCAHGAQLVLEFFRQLPAHAQEAVERLFSLVEIFLGELPRPCEAERGRLHRAFATLLGELC